MMSEPTLIAFENLRVLFLELQHFRLDGTGDTVVVCLDTLLLNHIMPYSHRDLPDRERHE